MGLSQILKWNINFITDKVWTKVQVDLVLATTLERPSSTPPCLLLMLEERTLLLSFFPDCWRTTKKGKCGGLSTSFILVSIMLVSVFSSMELWLCSDISGCSWVRSTVSVLFSTAKALRKKHWDKLSIAAKTGRTGRTAVLIMTTLQLNCDSLPALTFPVWHFNNDTGRVGLSQCCC